MRINKDSSKKELNGKDLKISIVFSRFNDSLGNTLLQNTLETLNKLKVPTKNILVTRVPGALELPITAKLITKKQKPDAIIALGIVIKGDTSHYDHVCTETHRGLMNVSLETQTPVVFGVITAFTENQAVERVQKNKLNKGQEYAQTAVEMALLKKDLQSKKRGK
ncbi:6,7-dimethyl-8-ribityllumazine synthase [Candidatus Peregrinibacteria bacterium]|nr:6,7-dimethyl-8-ribityllumazine synthase [Candidatus Peregrinibacteria bacterium]